MPSGDADVMLACKDASTYGTTSDIEMEHDSAGIEITLSMAGAASAAEPCVGLIECSGASHAPPQNYLHKDR